MVDAKDKLSIDEGDKPLFVLGTGLGTGDNEYWDPNDYGWTPEPETDVL